MVDSLRGQLLVASPAMLDPNFERTVVLITEHSEEGALGVILNRPSDTEVAEVVPALAGIEGVDHVYIGGPVRPEAVVVLGEFRDPDAAAWIAVADVGFVSADAENEELPDRLRRARVYAGFSGWSAGQLEGEIEEEAWIVEPPLPAELFAADAEHLWSEVLQRKGGHYALVARMPLDPSMN